MQITNENVRPRHNRQVRGFGFEEFMRMMIADDHFGDTYQKVYSQQNQGQYQYEHLAAIISTALIALYI